MPRKKSETPKAEPLPEVQTADASGSVPETPAIEPEAPAVAEQEVVGETPAVEPEAPADAKQEAVRQPRHRVRRVGEDAAVPPETRFVPQPATTVAYRVGQRVMATPSEITHLAAVKGFYPLPGHSPADSLYQVAVLKPSGFVEADGLWRVSVRGELYGWSPSPSLEGWQKIERVEVFEEPELPVRRPINPRPAGGLSVVIPDADFELPENINPDALIELGVPLPPEGYYREVYRNKQEAFLRASTQSGDYFLNRVDDGWMRWPVVPGTEAVPAAVWPPNSPPPPETPPAPAEWLQRPDSELSVRLQRLKQSTLGGG
jgi:hypothetical protein